MTSRPFSRAAAEDRLGPATVATARRLVDTAPPLSVETQERLRAVFATAAPRQPAVSQAA
ncbi:MAG TPA: hypothetical protein DEQ61_19970 [Streptomyces sp.]|nr:hypothetical protein [Streptomyces sp.]